MKRLCVIALTALAGAWISAGPAVADAPAATAPYSVLLHKDGTDKTETLGQVKLDETSHIAVTATRPGHGRKLKDVVARANQFDSLPVDSAAPGGGAKFTDYSTRVARTDPKFRDALFDYLRTYYDVEFKPQS